MEQFGLGAGLAALAFWGFLGSIIVGGIWYAVRERDAQHETVRRLVESGQPIDNELVDKLLALSGGRNKRLDRDFRLTAWIVLATAVGLAIFGLVLGYQFPVWQTPILGVAALVACVGLGFLMAAKVAARWYAVEGDSAFNRN